MVDVNARVDGRPSRQYRGTLATPTVAAFVALAAVLWGITIVGANDMGNMAGTMGMSVWAFVLMWALMMSAMMLPSVAPMALLYSRTVANHRRQRLGSFALGYVAAWALTGLVAYLLAWTAGELAAEASNLAQVAAVGVFAAVGAYQLTPLKYRCLDHCRSPLGHMFHYANFSGPTKDIRAGVHHGLYCLGCCWALMVLMVAFGVMNVLAMVGLAGVVAAEKLWRHGKHLARTAGWVSLALAVLVAFEPGVAPGLDPDNVMNMSGTMAGR